MKPFQYCPYCAAPLAPRHDGERVRLACACGFVAYDNPTPVVAAIVETEGGVVLARGRGWPEKVFALVTGFLERDESPEEGVAREVKEEIGLDVSDVRLVGLFPFPQQNQLILAYAMRGTGTIVLGDELEAYKLVPKERLRGWPFGTGLAVTAWLGVQQS
jgi:NAD+ diphosphatase